MRWLSMQAYGVLATESPRMSFGNDDCVFHWQVPNGDEPPLDVAEKIKESTVATVLWVEVHVERGVESVCEDSTAVGVDLDFPEVPLNGRDDSIRADTLGRIGRAKIGLSGQDERTKVATGR